MNYVSVQELAYDAEDFADSQVDAGGEFHVHYTRKFAELVVLEAIKVVQRRYMGDNNREDMEVRRCVEDLKKHFGVE